MKLLTYMTRTFSKFFLYTIIFLVGIFQVINTVEKYRTIPPSTPFHIIMKWIIYKSVFVAYLLLPVATIISVTLLLTAMNERREIIALFTSGVMPIKLINNLLILGIFSSIIAFGLGEFVVPFTETKTQEIYYTQIKKIPYKFSKIDKIWVQGNNCICKIDVFLVEEKAIKNLLIIRFDKKLRPIQLEHVDFATFIKGKWLFLNSTITDFSGGNPVTITRKWRIANNFPYDFKALTFLKQTPQEMNFIQLYHYISTLKKNGYVYPYLIAGLIQKFTIPLSNLLLFLIPLGIVVGNPRRKKAIIDFSLSLLLGFFYFGTTMISGTFVNKGIDPYLTTITPLLLLSLITIFILRKGEVI